MIVNGGIVSNGSFEGGYTDISSVFRAATTPGSFAWIDLLSPSTDEIQVLTDEVGLHPLAAEDLMRMHQRPKLEAFGAVQLIVLKPAHYDEPDEIRVAELHLLLGDTFLITSAQAQPDGLSEYLEELILKARTALKDLPLAIRNSPSAGVHTIMDAVVDSYGPIVVELENDIDEIETAVFSLARVNHAERIFKLKRQVLAFHRSAEPLLDSLRSLRMGQELPSELGAGSEKPLLANYHRDVEDHLIRVLGRVQACEALLTDALDANAAQISQRQNDDMRAMSGWAAVIAVPTLLAAIWGMNFREMPELKWQLGYLIALLSIALSGFLVWRQMKKRSWL